LPEVLTVNMKKILFTFFTFSLFTGAFAQYKTFKTRADKAFKNQNYYEAAYYYDLLVAGKNKSKQNIPFYASVKKEQVKAEYPYIRYQLAESYRLYHDYAKAQDWYAKIVADNDTVSYPLSRLWYGICLRAGKQFDEAIKQLQRFRISYKGDAQYIELANREIENCTFARRQYLAAPLIEVKKMRGQWIADGGSYALTKSAGYYWFTSSRLTGGDKNAVNHIYRVSGSNQSIPAVVTLNTPDPGNAIEYGSSFFDDVHKRLYVTGRYKEGDQIFFAIYYAVLQNDQWSPLQKLNANVNADGYNAIQPSVSPDGKRLLFASDKPGGEGGYDIWVSNLDADGNPMDAVNPGKTINTPQDDEAPFFDAAHNKLVYSSKGFTGLGGFDIYESYENNGQWSAPVNMGYPVNSSKDDLYYFADPDDPGKFYVSSDRESECCLALFELNYKVISIAGTVMDCDSNKALAGVKVSLIDSTSGKAIMQTQTGTAAGYSFNGLRIGAYQIKLEKNGYLSKIASLSGGSKDTLVNFNDCVQAVKTNHQIVIENVLYDFDKADLRPESKATLDSIVSIMKQHPSLRIKMASHTDSIGSEEYNLKLSQRRAQTCVDYIASKGIDRSRIIAVTGYGKSRPLAPNTLPNGQDNPDGRQMNRRTEFIIKE